ncbi:MAG TPA: multicopper oxidase domain-containing protein [Gemmatimonadaceae bacterium]|nr:multicopper oxidase domain-containing protein [Gemmatimonadaceae bacterium]
MSRSLLDRRRFVISGLTLAGATLVGTACNSDEITTVSGVDLHPNDAAALDSDLLEPPVIQSIGAVLSASITCATNPVKMGGRHAREPVTYNGSFPAPTLWVRPGDVIDIAFANKIIFDQADTKPGYGRPPRETHMTNLHFHGMHVSPEGTADNMAVMVPAMGKFGYRFHVPLDHPSGLYWYHAHVHGLVTNHVGRGAAGMIYVANEYTDTIANLGIRHRLMALQQAYFEDDHTTLISNDAERDDPDVALSLINGQLMPDIRIRPGEPQVWSLLNASTSAFYVLRLEGHTFDVIAQDGIPVPSVRTGQETLMMASGSRLEVVVRGNPTKGRYALSYDSYDQGVDTWPHKSIATVIVAGSSWNGADHPGVDHSVGLTDLTGVSVPLELHRTIVFAQDSSVAEGEFGRFTMNGHPFDPAHSEWTSTLNTVEEWLIRNDTNQDHPFHVHVNPFQVTRINGGAVPFGGFQDVAIVPRFGSITVRTKFTDFTGNLILMHCHILDHEDMGMMTLFEIAPA